MAKETKEERFKRVAVKRVQRVLDSIRSLSQCSNKRMYQWNQNMLKKVWESIDNELKLCKNSFEKGEPEDFSF